MFVSIMRSLLVLYLFSFQLVMASEPLPAAIQAFEKQGMHIVGRFDAPNGMQGYAAEYQKQGITLYVSRDGKFVLSGYLYDAKGNNLSLKPLNELVYSPMAKQVWAKLQKSSWIADGKDNAPKIIYMFSDPNCPYCNRFWQLARPWVEGGKVQIRHILVGILSHDSPAKAAALFNMKDPIKGLQEYEESKGKNGLKPLDPIPSAIQKKLDDNQVLMDELGSVATPTLLYLDETGRLQQQQGMPEPKEMDKILGKLN